MKPFSTGFAIVLVVIAAFALKWWQCEELFPHASKTACMLFR